MRGAALGGVVCVLAGALALGCAQHSQSPEQTRLLPGRQVAAITAPAQIAAAGAQQPDVRIVEYMDYNCPYCRAMAPDLNQLLQADRHVQIVYKEWPILGDGSVYAARSALAANWQGKYLIAHDALIGAARDLDQNSDVDAVLQAAGLDLARLEADRKSHATEIDALLARSAQETNSVGIKGTPALLVGRQLVARALSLPELQNLIAAARAETR